MKRTLIIGLLILSNSVSGQIPGKKFDGPMVIFDTLTIKKGDIIFLGKGSDPISGNFLHITTPKKYMTDFSGNKTHEEFKNTPQGISNNYNGRTFAIKDFSKVSSKKNGDMILGVIDVGPSFDGTLNLGMYKQAVNFEAAILAGEIVKINDIDFTKPSRTIEIPHFVFNKDGVQPISVVFNDISKDELYAKTLRWYRDYYKNRDASFLSVIEKERVGIVGLQRGVLISRVFGADVFADLEYRFLIDFIGNEINMNFMIGGEDGQITPDDSPDDYFDENGETRDINEDSKNSIEQMMNEISVSLVDYLLKM